MWTDVQQTIIDGDIANRAIYAGPGSGKTATLTAHLIRLIASRRVAPSNMVVMTFTRQAAIELKRRLESSSLITRQQVASLRIGTFHSMVFRMLLQLKVDVYPLMSETAQHRILGHLTHAFARQEPTGIDAWITSLSRVRATWPHTIAPPNTRRLLEAYSRKKQHLGLWDFDDVLEAMCSTIESSTHDWKQVPPIHYLLVDEFQDTNGIQVHILRHLHHQFRAPIFVVGDEDQSIYGFRGADPTWLLDFPTLFEDVTSHIMVDNFRSDKSIVQTSNRLIQNNRCRADKSPRLTSDQEGYTGWFLWRDEHQQALGIRMLVKQSTTPGSISILARTRAELEQVANIVGNEPNGPVAYHTFHACKGKEWDEVHLVGAVEPNPWLRHHAELDGEEERRLFYVAMTRARHRLCIHSSKRYLGHRVTPSRFVHESGIAMDVGPENRGS